MFRPTRSGPPPQLPGPGAIFLSGKATSVYNRPTSKPYSLTFRIGGLHGRVRPEHDPVQFQPPSHLELKI